MKKTAITVLFLSLVLSASALAQEMDDGDFMLRAKIHSEKVALKTIQEGKPNSYIGHPGVTSGLDGTPLYFLIETNLENVKYALAHGALPDLPSYWDDKVHRYPLEVALESGRWETVELLLDAGADLANVPLPRVLSGTIWQGECVKCVKYVLGQGADPNEGDSDFLPLTLLADRWDGNPVYIEMAEIIMGAGGDPDKKDGQGKSFRDRVDPASALGKKFY